MDSLRRKCLEEPSGSLRKQRTNNFVFVRCLTSGSSWCVDFPFVLRAFFLLSRKTYSASAQQTHSSACVVVEIFEFPNHASHPATAVSVCTPFATYPCRPCDMRNTRTMYRRRRISVWNVKHLHLDVPQASDRSCPAKVISVGRA